MGVVKRQGVKQSAVNMIGALMGMVNVLIIYLFALTPDEIGLTRFLLDAALFISPFIFLGHNAMIIRFFPTFKSDEKGHQGFLFFLSAGTFVGFLLFLGLYLILGERVLDVFGNATDFSGQFIKYVVPLTLLVTFQNLLVAYVTNFHRIVVPAIITTAYKFVLPTLSLLYFYEYITLTHLVWGILGYYVCALIAMILYTKHLGELHLRPDFSLLKKPLLKNMYTYGFYGILGGLGTILATRIDTLMVTSILGFTQTGVYTVAFFIAGIVSIPTEAINRITAPILAKAWHENNTKEIEKIYKSSSINLLIIGLTLFLGVWLNVDDLFDFMPNGELYAPGKYVILLLAIAKLFDMATSVNGHIIGYSSFFRFNFYAILGLAVFNVICNVLFIPIFQIEGAALATMSSLLLFNILKVGFIWWRFKMQPFTTNTLYLLGLAAAVFVLVLLLPDTGFPLLNILIKGSVTVLLFVGSVFYFKISKEFNDLIINGLEQVKEFLKK